MLSQNIRFCVSLILSLLIHILVVYHLPELSHPLPKIAWVKLVEMRKEPFLAKSELLKGGTAKNPSLKGDFSFERLEATSSILKKNIVRKPILSLRASIKTRINPKEESKGASNVREDKNKFTLASEKTETFDKVENVEKLDKEIDEESSLIPPKPLITREPSYPTIARKMRYEGVVVLDIEVLPDGNAGEIKIVESSGYEILDKTALEEVKKWRFIPAYRNGKPIKSVVRQKILFRLR